MRVIAKFKHFCAFIAEMFNEDGARFELTNGGRTK